MPPELQEMLGRIADLTDEELQDLEQRLIAAFDEADEAQNVQAMDEIAAGINTVRSTQTTREQEREQNAQRAAELRNQVHPQEDEGEGEGDGQPAEQNAEGDALPVAASTTTRNRPSIQQLAASRSPQHAPRATPNSGQGTARVRLMSAAGVRRAGDDLTSYDELIESMTDRINRLGASTNGDLLIARAEVEYPEDRRLINGDANHNGRLFERDNSPQAIVAAGGVCAPFDVDYSIMVVSVDDEPVFDSLPKYQAARGGLRYLEGPTLAGVGTAATAVWTNATDVNPGASVKPVQTVQCGVEEETVVDAIPTRIRFGNAMGRFSPEIVASNTTLIQAAAARIRELYLINAISAGSISVSSGQLLGASRDLLATMDQIAAAYRRRHRLPRSGFNMRAMLPDWAIDIVRADLTRELAHDGDTSNMALTDAQVETLLASRGLAVTWMMDGQVANAGTGTSAAYVDQSFAAAQNAGPLLDWPAEMVWYMFAEGTWQVIDGGTLDIGVVRDSTLDSTNDYETFIEVYRAVAKRGFESIQVVSHIRPNGASAATVQTATSPAIY